MQEGSLAAPRVAAVVVLYHPVVDQLGRLYEGIRRQVDCVWLIDNTPLASGEVFAPAGAKLPWEVRYLALGDNLGIAQAQNVGIREVQRAGFDHVLLLDQDSLLPEKTVATLLQAEQDLLSKGIDVAAVGPVFVDEKTHLPGSSHHHVWFWQRKSPVDLNAPGPVLTDWLIASGSLVRVSVYDRVGLMREEMFIDAVDMEWGIRARSLGLSSFVVPAAPISHSVGDSFRRLLGVSVILHGELRNYYIARNWIYLLRVPTMGNRWRSSALQHALKFILVHTWFSDRKTSQLRYFRRAVTDAVLGRMGRYRA